jgi:hypothetical protein
MSQILIQEYLNELSDLRRVSGTARESVVREAFKTLLKNWGRSSGREADQFIGADQAAEARSIGAARRPAFKLVDDQPREVAVLLQ